MGGDDAYSEFGEPGFFAWRALVDAAAVSLCPRPEAIAPFGFEITGDVRYVAKTYTRYYVYLRGQNTGEQPCAQADGLLAGAFVAALLAADPRAAEAFRVVVLGSTVELREVPGRASLYVKVIHPTVPLVSAYARYIAGASALILQKTLLEAAAFASAASARRYIFQLTVIIASLYPERSNLSPESVDALRERIRALPDRDPDTGAPAIFPESERDRMLWERVVVPVHRCVSAYLADGAKSHREAVLDIHSGELHRVVANRDTFADTERRIISRYKTYPSDAS